MSHKKPLPPGLRPELFLIHEDCVDATDPKELQQTIKAMMELDLVHLPYPNLDIEIPARVFIRFFCKLSPVKRTESEVEEHLSHINPQQKIRLCYRDNGFYKAFAFKHNKNAIDMLDVAYMERLCLLDTSLTYEKIVEIVVTKALFYHDLLIVMLATKNIIKTRKENKSLKMGINLKNEFTSLYTTTLSIPKSEHLSDDTDHPPTPGRSPRPHLRMGHIRNQKYGPRNSFTKQVWIPPVFVNSDDTYVSQRDHYNVSQAQDEDRYV